MILTILVILGMLYEQNQLGLLTELILLSTASY